MLVQQHCSPHWAPAAAFGRFERCATTSSSPPDLSTPICSKCQGSLEVAPEALVYPCRRCGLAFESTESGLRLLEPYTAAITTALIIPTGLRYLAVWRFTAEVEVRAKRSRSAAPPGHTWDQVKRIAAPGPPALFVPAFVLSRMVVMQLGVRLVQAQPHLILEKSIPEEAPERPRLVVEGSAPRLRLPPGSQALGDAADEGPGFRTLSPIVLNEEDAELVAHFVYLALEARMTPDLRGIDYDLALSDAGLLFLPAVFDPRYVHDCNWRFLLREFDGLVA